MSLIDTAKVYSFSFNDAANYGLNVKDLINNKVSREDLIKLFAIITEKDYNLKNDDKRAYDTLVRSAGLYVLSKGEMFDFGHLNKDFIPDNSQYGINLFHHKKIKFPYSYQVFHSTYDAYDDTLESDKVFKDLKGVIFHIFNVIYVKEDTQYYYMIEIRFTCLRNVFVVQIKIVGKSKLELKDDKSEVQYLIGQEDYKRLNEEQVFFTLTSIEVPVALNYALNIRGISAKREDYSKLNKTRVKCGKMPIPAYNKIDLTTYIRACSNHNDHTSDRNSPRPHLRRGHIRHFSDGSTSWIRDTVVALGNGDASNIAQRKKYSSKIDKNN